jgi:hypothetical protein
MKLIDPIQSVIHEPQTSLPQQISLQANFLVRRHYAAMFCTFAP